jgi:hypothetical protein
VGELDGVDGSLLQQAKITSASARARRRSTAHTTHRSNDISNVRDTSSTGGPKVEDLLSGSDVDVIESTEDTGGKLGAERVPHAVLDLLRWQFGVGRGGFNRDALLAVDRVAGNEVASDEKVLLALRERKRESASRKLQPEKSDNAPWRQTLPGGDGARE